MANNVTLHQKNKDGAYDNLYPRTTADHTMLTSATGTKYGLTDGNAEQAVGISMQFIQTIGAISIYVKDPLGNPIEGAIIQGLTGNPSTNASGFVQGTLVNNPITVKSPYADLKDKSVDASGYVGTTRALNVTLDSIGENGIVRYTSSTNVKFSPVTKTVDVCCVGGGGGGGRGSTSATYGFYTGAGGGGGGIVNKMGLSVEPNKYYPLSIAMGGAVGNSGGNTTAFGVSAPGGTGATLGEYPYYDLYPGKAGVVGCGDGSRAETTTGNYNTTVSEFNDGVIFYSGGGAGGRTETNSPYSGGTPNGADGAWARYGEGKVAGYAGIGGGGGGMAGYYNQNYPETNVTASASRGGSGLVAIRIHLS